MKRLLSMPWMLLFAAMLAWPALAQSPLRIVTVVPAAANTTVADEDGDFPAYIVVQALQSRSLSGHYLSNDPEFANVWQIPAGYALTAGQTLRIFASGKDRRPTGPGGVLHTSFIYDCKVPYCGLFTAQQTPVDTYFDDVDQCRCDGLPLLDKRPIARVLIPTEDIGLEWTLPQFNDKGWIRGPLGVGYDIGSNPFRAGLVLYHTYDKAHVVQTTVPDVSGPILHTGNINGSPSMVAGRVAEAFQFNGDGAPPGSVLVSHHTELNPGSGPFSVAIWFRPARGQGSASGAAFNEVLVSKLGPVQVGSQSTGGWAITRNLTGTFVRTASAGGAQSVSLGTTSPNQWNHAVLVVNRASNELVGYLNGKRMGATALSSAAGPIATIADMVEGRDLQGASPYVGLLDDIAVWNRALGDSEVGQLFAIGQQGKSLIDPAAVPGGSSLYAPLIGTDVLTRMRGVNASAYIRVPFNVPAISSITVGLKLRVHFDDGFVAYLNGVEVARRNAPDSVDFLSASASNRPDPAALAGEAIDLSSFIGLLKPGGNLLAFHALNHDPDAERFVLAPTQLCMEVIRTPPTGGGNCVKETNGRDFWVTFPQNYSQEPDTPLHLSLCIAGPPQTKGIIEIPGMNLPGYPRLFTIPPSGAARIELPPKAELAGADAIEKKGIHILTTANVAVYGTTRMDYTTDSFLALPTPCLGTEYLVSTFRNVFDGIPVLNGSQFAIVAVANGTEVTVVPPAKVGSHPAQQPYLIKLQRGETYQLRQEAGQPADLTGARLVSNKPIAVFGSHRCANVQSVNQFFCDTVVEELLPVASWGSSFFIVPLETRKSDTVRVLSSDNDNLVTVVTLAGNQSFVLQRGQFKDLVLERPTRINCRAPSMVMQFANSSDADQVTKADPFMTMIQPLNTWLSQYRFCTPAAADFEDNYLHLIAPSKSLLDLATVNGTTVAAWNPAEISTGSLPSGYVFARLKLKPDTSYIVLGRERLGMIAYGFSEFDSYGYPGGMGFQGSPAPVLTCPSDVTVNCQNVPGTTGCVGIVPDFALRVDVFDDCTEKGQLAVSQKPAPGTPLQPGTYTVTVTATDGSGKTTECAVKFTVQTSWPNQQFGPNTAANPALEKTVWGALADPDKDGLINAMEEALGSDPNARTPMSSVLEITTEQDEWGAFPVVTLPRLLNGDGPVIELEGASALDASEWASGPDILEELPGRNTPTPGGKHERVVYKVREPLKEGSTGAYFLRFKLKE